MIPAAADTGKIILAFAMVSATLQLRPQVGAPLGQTLDAHRFREFSSFVYAADIVKIEFHSPKGEDPFGLQVFTRMIVRHAHEYARGGQQAVSITAVSCNGQRTETDFGRPVLLETQDHQLLVTNDAGESKLLDPTYIQQLHAVSATEEGMLHMLYFAYAATLPIVMHLINEQSFTCYIPAAPQGAPQSGRQKVYVERL